MADETFRDGGFSVDIPSTPSTLTVVPTDLSGGTSECHLHIPFKSAGAELAEALQGMGDVPPAVREALQRMDQNWKRIEEWAAYYIAHCRCRCRGSATGGT